MSRLRNSILATVVLAAAVAVGVARAAPGTPDPTFGVDGRVTTDVGLFDQGLAVAVQPDGKIVAAGSGGPTNDMLVARYDPNGSLDAAFGIGGIVTTNFGGSDGANDVVLEPDGKIVVAGFTSGPVVGYALARYTPDGALDPTFGNSGTVLTDVGPGADFAFGVVRQPDGKLVVAGSVGAPRDFALLRYNGDGTIDETFGAGGMVTTDLGGDDRATSVVLQSDGKLVVAGVAVGADFALARYLPDGTLDASFGSGGTVTTDHGATDIADDVTLQRDGRIVAAGRTGVPLANDFALARYLADGSLDASFGTGGTTKVDFVGGDALAFGVAIQANGKVVAAGSVTLPGFDGFAFARLNADGGLDTTFSPTGLSAVSFSPVPDRALDVTIQNDGKILAVGSAGSPRGGLDFALTRLEGDPTVRAVRIDVKPGSDVNPINVGANGAVPVAILGGADFDATTVDPSSVCFGADDEPDRRDCSASAHVEDVDADGVADLMLHFDVAQTGIDTGDTRACLTGTTVSGVRIAGCDSIRT